MRWRSVFVPMVDVRKVGMCMPHRLMFVRMRMRFDTVPIGTMLVTVMLVMRVRVGVIPVDVLMLMYVPFRDVKPDTQRHQQSRCYQRESQRFVL